MAKINIRKLHVNDLNKLPTFFSEHLHFIEPNQSTDQKLRIKQLYSHYTKRLYFHYIPSILLNSLDFDIFDGSVAQYHVNIVGVVIIRRFPLGKSWVLGPIVVHTNFRRLGIATHLMNFAMKTLKEKKAKSVILPIERNNIQGRKFFEKFGFKYLEPTFSDHNRARNYARITALVHSYLRNPSYKIERYPSRRKVDLPEIEKARMWHIMFKEID